MRISIVTREWPPDIYGGAGVHVEHLVAELRKLQTVDVHCFGADKPGAVSYPTPTGLTRANAAIQTLGVNLEMIGDFAEADVIHSHTWYANMAGHIGSLLHGVPHVLTAHSLEPRRPWKAEQLGGGYAVSSWAESTAYHAADAVIAVSNGMRRDILECYPGVDPAKVHVVYNGIDTQAVRKVADTSALTAHGIDPQPLRKKIADITDLIAREDADTTALLGEGSGRGAPAPIGDRVSRAASMPEQIGRAHV